MPEDDARAMTIILQIIHGKFAEVPSNLKLCILFDLAVLSDKYDLAGCLSLWAEDWARPHRTIPDQGEAIDAYKLWIAWEFGDAPVFRKLARKLLMGSFMESGTKLLPPSGMITNHIPSPPRLLGKCYQPGSILLVKANVRTPEAIKTIRAATVKAMVEVVATRVHDWNSWDNSFCQSSDVESKMRCEHVILGSLLTQLKKAGLYAAAFKGKPCKHSISDLSHSLQNLEIDTLEEFRLSLDEHGNCDPTAQIAVEISEIVEGMASPIDEAHERHLEAQAKKTGVDWRD